MDIVFFLKAGFMGFALCLGTLMLVFFVLLRFAKLQRTSFTRIFILAAVASFLVLDVFLYYKIAISQTPNAQAFLAACIGGWLGGIFSGLTNMKSVLLRF
jgi:hypothetical protein